MNKNSLFPESTKELAEEKAKLSMDNLKAWRKFSRTVFKDGALSEKTKHLIAIAVAHVTQCPYCIRSHTSQALDTDATEKEIMEAIWVAAAGRASGAYSHAALSVDQMEAIDRASNGEHKDLYPVATPEMARKKGKIVPKTTEKWRNFSDTVFKAGELSEKTKQLIALGISHVTQCAYCIKGHTKMAKVKGATNEQMMEAIWVAAEMRAGAAYAHGTIAMDEIMKHKKVEG